MFFYAIAKSFIAPLPRSRPFYTKGISPCVMRPLRNSQRQVLILPQGKIFFGESSSVRLHRLCDFPLMPRLTRSDGVETHRVERNESAPSLVELVRVTAFSARDENIVFKQQTWREVGDVGFG